jgi:hypothetical protein
VERGERNFSIKSMFLNATIPFFLIVFPDESNDNNIDDNAEFHWWTSHEMDIDEVGETLTCPNYLNKNNKKIGSVNRRTIT